MLGAIAGDMIGAPYERHACTNMTFPLFGKQSRFTDDTVMTVATAWALLTGTGYAESYRKFGAAHPGRGYGHRFRQWLFHPEAGPYNSYGNGSAMRVSPVGFVRDSVEEVLAEARRSAEVTHNHPEGIKGAQAVALAVYLARTGASKTEIRRELADRFDYDFNRTLAAIRPDYRFDASCRGSVPEALIALLESESFEGAVRNAVSLGGDADTQGCIAGGVAEAHYGGVPREILEEVRKRLPDDLSAVVEEFYVRFAGRLPWAPAPPTRSLP